MLPPFLDIYLYKEYIKVNCKLHGGRRIEGMELIRAYRSSTVEYIDVALGEGRDDWY